MHNDVLPDILRKTKISTDTFNAVHLDKLDAPQENQQQQEKWDMTKWADYAISDVHFNDKHTHIDRVKARADNGEGLGTATDHVRADIISAIRRGTTYVTIFKTTDEKWKKGQPVYIIKVNGMEYIKTVDNGKPVDNLDNLPEY